jgi:hypothetical protein
MAKLPSFAAPSAVPSVSFRDAILSMEGPTPRLSRAPLQVPALVKRRWSSARRSSPLRPAAVVCPSGLAFRTARWTRTSPGRRSRPASALAPARAKRVCMSMSLSGAGEGWGAPRDAIAHPRHRVAAPPPARSHVPYFTTMLRRSAHAARGRERGERGGGAGPGLGRDGDL